MKNVNLRAAYIHILGDMLQSVGVILAAAIIFWRPRYSIVDPICTFTFSIIVFIVTMSIVKDCLRIIMEATPKGINLYAIKRDLLKIKGVETIHDLHVWALTQNKNALTVHIESKTPDMTLVEA